MKRSTRKAHRRKAARRAAKTLQQKLNAVMRALSDNNVVKAYRHEKAFGDDTDHIDLERDGKTYIVNKAGQRVLWDVDEDFCESAVRSGVWVKEEVQ